ncbi:MAG: hypothetical protein DI537_51960 [Stutzerimonas stutzeri]|nr:MAG: hypothetical protein DI537_51960 [Stutzerimonas stutzeri]
MTILMWDKPKKVMTVEQWAEHYGFEDGPKGGYSPNMSEADQLAWKAKITGKKLGFPQVEIRKTTDRGSQVLIIVSLGEGYNYKQYLAVSKDTYFPDEAAYIAAIGPGSRYPQHETIEEAKKGYELYRYPTKGINIHMATNGPIQMTFDELGHMNEAIEEAKTALLALLDIKSRQGVLV